MPHQSPKSDFPRRFFFASLAVEPELVRQVATVTALAVLALCAALRPPVGPVASSVVVPSNFQLVEVQTAGELVQELKELGLWEVGPEAEIPPVVFSGLPPDLKKMDVGTRKRVFLHSLLPVVMVALAEVRQERAALLAIARKLGDCRVDLLVAEKQRGWGCDLTRNQVSFLRKLSRKYRTTKLGELLARVNVVPVSLVLAQAALESSWGASRFASEGNNLFGVWTWGERGMVPARREDGKRHKVAMYDTILDSVRSYILMLNRLPAYQRFREIRSRTMEPLELAQGLLFYSERREDYIADLARVIRKNRLGRYDQCVLAASSRVQWGGWLASAARET